jgi:hypothetical protein
MQGAELACKINGKHQHANDAKQPGSSITCVGMKGTAYVQGKWQNGSMLAGIGIRRPFSALSY